MIRRIINFIEKSKNSDPISADIAKERLSMVVSYNKVAKSLSNDDLVEKLQDELFHVIRKYVGIIDDNMIKVKLEKKAYNDTLEINVELPEKQIDTY